MRMPFPRPTVAALTAILLIAIPATLAAGPATPALVSIEQRDAVWARDCRQPVSGPIARSSGSRLRGVGASCDLLFAPGGRVVLADDLSRGGQLVAVTSRGMRVLSPTNLAVRTPVSPSPDGSSVAYCSDIQYGLPALGVPVLLISKLRGGAVRSLGTGCDPAWIPAGLVYVSSFVHSFADTYGDTVSMLPTGSAAPRRLTSSPGITDLVALPGIDEVGVVTAEPAVSQTLTVISPRGGRPWRVHRVVDGALNVAAPMRGARFTFAASSRTGATRLYLADARARTVTPLGPVATGRALWSVDGRVLVWATPHRWRFYDPVTGRLLGTTPGHGVFAALQ